MVEGGRCRVQLRDAAVIQGGMVGAGVTMAAMGKVQWKQV